jgi:glycosyltransferase involved in cell wall biosynthesis
MVSNIYRYRSSRLEGILLRSIDFGPVVLPAKHLAEDFVAIQPSIARSLHVIPNGVDTNLFQPRPDPLPATSKKIVSLGHLNHNKNQEFLLDVADNLRSITTSAFEFVLYGPDDGEYGAQLVEKIRLRGLDDYFTFGGITTEPSKVLQEAWGYVNCSVTETFPVSVLEALASGLPVFATPNAGNREILARDCAGFLSASPREMARNIADLEISGTYEDASRSARRLAEGRFKESAFVESFHDLLLSVETREKLSEDFLAALLLGPWATDLLERRNQPDLMRIGVLVPDREQIAVQLLADEALGFLERQGKVSWVFINGSENSKVADTCDLLLIIRLYDGRAFRLAEQFTLAGKPVIFETDDNYFALKQSESGIEHVTWQNRDLEAIATISDAVIVYSTESLRAFSPFNRNTHILPAFQVLEFGALDKSPDNPEMMTIGYMGSLDRDIDFEFLTDALSQILDERKDVRLQFAGFIPQQLVGRPNVSHIPFQSSYRDFMASVRGWRWDIGLAPLAETSFNMSKTANKYREYGAAGIPAVYSDVPIYREVIDDGVNGVLAKNSSREWKHAMLNLIDSPEHRKRIRDEAREDVAKRFPLEAHAKAKFEIFSMSFAIANDRVLALQASSSNRGNRGGFKSPEIPIPGSYVERVVEWPGESSVMFVSVDLFAGIRQGITLEVVHNNTIIYNQLVFAPSEFFPVYSPSLLVPGTVCLRVANASEEMPAVIAKSRLRQLDSVIRVLGSIRGPQSRSGAMIARRFVHFVRDRINRA